MVRGAGLAPHAAWLLGALLAAGCASGSPLRLEEAWREANLRAGVTAPGPPPEVDWRAGGGSTARCGSPAEESHTLARYLPDRDRVEILSICERPLHGLLVHEFLHAIRERSRREIEGDLAGYDPEGEDWVRERSAARIPAPSMRPSTSLR